MNAIARKLTSCACACALAAGMTPATAFAADLGQATIAEDALAAKAAAIDSLADGAYEDDSIIVVYRKGATETKKAERGMTTQSVEVGDIARSQAEVLSESAGCEGEGASMVVDVPENTTVGEAVAAVEADPDVLYAQPNFRYYLADEPAGANAMAQIEDAMASALRSVQMSIEPADSSTNYELPNDPYVSVKENDTSNYPSKPNQWWIHSVNAPAAWQQVHGDDNLVTVAVLDTGIDFTHEDLRANILADYAYDSYHQTKLTESIDDDEMQHGCHVAGIIAATANNGIGIAGVSYNAKVLPIRVFHQADQHGGGKATCSDEDLIRAYDYLMSDEDGNGRTVAEETHTRVVNMSLGGYLKDEADYYGGDPMDYYDYAFEDKIHEAQEEANILSVGAAGNGDSNYQGRTDASYPSDYDDVMGVMALKTDTARTTWSDYNDHKNISAPGNNIFSTYWSATEGSSFNNTKYAFESGTSMATPLVCGCAALLWAYDPNLSVADVKEALYDTAADYGDKYGAGRIDVGAAVASLGTASVKGEKNTMVRTDTQQMTAAEIADSTSSHKWTWSVTDQETGAATTKARIDASGRLTAIEAGKVVVTATAKDNLSITGRRVIEITEIQIADGIEAAANPAESTIAVRWATPDVATSYRIERATNAVGDTTSAGAFSEVANVSAASITSGDSVTFLDRSAEVGELYWYKVTPYGQLAGADGATTTVEGLPSTSNRSFFTDKRALKANIIEAENLLASTATSADGANLTVSQFWTTPDERKSLKKAVNEAYSAYMNGTMLQLTVDARNDALVAASDEFKASRKAGSKALSANTLTAKSLKKSVSKAYGKSMTLSPASLYSVSGAQGDVTFQKVSGNSLIKVASTGGVTVSKKLACGSYSVQVAVTAAGNEIYAASTKAVSFKVNVTKLANGLNASAKQASVSASKLKKSAQKVKVASAVKVSGAAGQVTYAKGKGTHAGISVSKAGVITLKKGLKKGTYKANIVVSAAGDATHEAASKTVAVKVKVK